MGFLLSMITNKGSRDPPAGGERNPRMAEFFAQYDLQPH